jgi:hypothetical protein
MRERPTATQIAPVLRAREAWAALMTIRARPMRISERLDL